MKCKCGCGQELPPLSRSTKYRIAKGKNSGYIRGHAFKGTNNHNWKGGQTIDSKGYRFIRMPDHPNAKKNGYVAEAHVVMSNHLGRPIAKNEVVHHINGNKLDNHLENLVLIKRKEHNSYHPREKIRIPKICPTCGKPFTKALSQNHKRDKYCSRKCINMSGENHPLAKLSQEQVAEIRQLKGKLSQRKIAKTYNIGKSQVARIHNGTSWASK